MNQKPRNNIRFCKQRDQHSCGPIALLNVDKFFGERVTYQDLQFYQGLVDCKPPRGTYTSDMSKLLGRARRKSWNSTKKTLQGCTGCLIIQTGDGLGGRKGHYSMICLDRHGNYYLVNHFRNQEYAALQISWQQAYWVWRKAYRVWYVEQSVLENYNERCQKNTTPLYD